MRITLHDTRALPATDFLALFVISGERPVLPDGVQLPAPSLRSFSAEFRELRATDALRGPAKRVALIGLGKLKDLTAERLRRVAAVAVRSAEAGKQRSAVLWCPRALETRLGATVAGRALAEGAELGAYSFTTLKSKAPQRKLTRTRLCLASSGARSAARHGLVLARANAYARDLQNLPGNLMRPRDLAAEARKLARASRRIRCRVLDERALARAGLNALLAVARGSQEPAFLIHLVYRPRGRARERIALVGKGLTFDAGGISIKPAAKMEEMKYDMSGGAAVLGVFQALASLELPFEIHGLVPTTENLLDGGAVKPGDVVRAMNGTTIEIQNTDAEGRLILCDALSYAQKHVKPEVIVDLATLTGAVVVALGHELSGLLGNHAALQDELVAAGEAVGEALWKLPLLECHRDQMKSRIADLKNVNAGEGNGASAGAAFLAPFVGDTPWAHLDIAGSAWGGIERDWVGGPLGSGVGVRLLFEWLERRARRT